MDILVLRGPDSTRRKKPPRSGEIPSAKAARKRFAAEFALAGQICPAAKFAEFWSRMTPLTAKVLPIFYRVAPHSLRGGSRLISESFKRGEAIGQKDSGGCRFPRGAGRAGRPLSHPARRRRGCVYRAVPDLIFKSALHPVPREHPLRGAGFCSRTAARMAGGDPGQNIFCAARESKICAQLFLNLKNTPARRARKSETHRLFCARSRFASLRRLGRLF